MPDLASSIIGAFFTQTPQMPAAPQVSATQQQGLAIAGNQQNLAADEALTGQTNAFMSQQMQTMLEKAIPGYTKILGQQSQILQSELAGNIPQADQAALQEATAGQANYGGFGQSGMKQNLTARDLGLTSLGITNSALSSANQWMNQIASLAMPQMMNLQSMFVTPSQEIQNAWQNQLSSFQRNWANNVNQANANNSANLSIGNLMDPAGTYLTGGGGGSPGSMSPNLGSMMSGFGQGYQTPSYGSPSAPLSTGSTGQWTGGDPSSMMPDSNAISGGGVTGGTSGGAMAGMGSISSLAGLIA